MIGILTILSADCTLYALFPGKSPAFARSAFNWRKTQHDIWADLDGWLKLHDDSLVGDAKDMQE
jgi:hypothetical protein